MKDEALVLIRFIRREAPFEAGEERLFPKREAEKFIAQGAAETVDRKRKRADRD